MEYGILINGQLIIHRVRQEGDKPIIRTQAPTFAYNEIPFFYWEEDDGQVVQRWGANIDPDMPEPGLSDSEALEILLGGAT